MRFFRLIAILCLAFLAQRALPQEEPKDLRAPKLRPKPTPGAVYSSLDGKFRWAEGDDYVTAYDSERQISRRLHLPSNLEKASSRKVLFADRGRYFCVLDEYSQEVGLHLAARKGAKSAKALVLNATLRLIDQYGNTLWLRNMPDKYVVGDPSEAQVLHISNNGTLAILLQDIDPYQKARPMLIVMSPRGLKKLRLDYTSWTKIEEFALSDDGKYLAVRGYGIIPEEEHWDKSLGFYLIGSDKSWIVPIPSASEARALKTLSSDGWACCVQEGGVPVSINFEGNRKAMRRGLAP